MFPCHRQYVFPLELLSSVFHLQSSISTLLQCIAFYTLYRILTTTNNVAFHSKKDVGKNKKR